MKTLHLSIFLTILAVAMSSFILTDANAVSPFLQTDKTFHVKGDIILVYGSVGNYTSNTNATIQILDNKNNLLVNSTTTPKNDGTFLVRIPTNDTNWKTGGPYKISVQYGTCCHVGDSTFTFYTGLLPPLKQAQLGTVFWDIACDSGLVKIMKQEDGFVACVKPVSVQKLVSWNWGYDPSEKLTTYGFKDVYQVGQEIDFKFRINGFGNSCEQPSVTVRNSTQQIVWSSPQYSSSCATGEPGHVESEAFLGNETHLGYDYNGYGLLIIKQPGTYFMNISWLDGNVTKEFAVIQSNNTDENHTNTLEKNNGSLSGNVSSYVYGGPLGSMTNRSSNYVVSVYMADGITLAGKTISDSNAHYFMQLPAGNYIIYTYNEIKQKYTISISAGKNTIFNITSSIHVP